MSFSAVARSAVSRSSIAPSGKEDRPRCDELAEPLAARQDASGAIGSELLRLPSDSSVEAAVTAVSRQCRSALASAKESRESRGDNGCSCCRCCCCCNSGGGAVSCPLRTLGDTADRDGAPRSNLYPVVPREAAALASGASPPRFAALGAGTELPPSLWEGSLWRSTCCSL